MQKRNRSLNCASICLYLHKNFWTGGQKANRNVSVSSLDRAGRIQGSFHCFYSFIYSFCTYFWALQTWRKEGKEGGKDEGKEGGGGRSKEKTRQEGGNEWRRRGIPLLGSLGDDSAHGAQPLLNNFYVSCTYISCMVFFLKSSNLKDVLQSIKQEAIALLVHLFSDRVIISRPTFQND